MKSYIASGLLASMAATRALAQDCTNSHDSTGVNYYKCAVQAMTFDNVQYSGTYNQVTYMDSTGACPKTPVGYSGAMAPLNDEVSLHFRGPVQIKQFAVYSLGSSAPAKKVRRDSASRHHHKRGRNAHKHKRVAQTDWVTATIDGIVQSWTNNYHPGAPATEAAAEASTSIAVNFKPQIKMVNPTAQSYIRSAVTSDQAYVPDATSAPTAAAAPSSSTIPSLPISSSGSGYGSGGSGSWQLQGYYNAQSQQADGVAFFNNKGGQGSGVWDTTWGNSLSYSDSTGCGGTANSTILGNVLIPSVEEVIIMSDTPCNGDCPFSRAPDVAYKGFAGAQKAFFFEFSMPHAAGNDMPAIWMLNAQIPRTGQYNNCSCWTTGCGEFDIFETLAAGEERCTTTLHAGLNNQAGVGADNYFKRPTTYYQKAVVLMNEEKIHVQYLDDSVQWGSGVESIDQSVISGMCGNTGSAYNAPS